MAGDSTTYADNKVLSYYFGGTTSAPATWYVAVHAVNSWVASTPYTLNTFVVPASGAVQRVFVCTTAGTSGSSQPSWPNTAGGTVTDGTVVWTEATATLDAGTFPTEVSGNAYARVSVTNNTTNWPAASGGSSSNGTLIQFAQATGTWGNIALVTLWDASSSGNCWFWQVPTVFRQTLQYDQLQFPVGALVITAS